MQSDFDRCVLRISDSGNEDIQGRLRLELLVRASGEVYAAFVHSEKGVEDRRLERCLVAAALFWKLPEVSVDYSRPYVLSFVPGGTEMDFSDPVYWSGQHYAGQGRASVFMPDINDAPPPAEVDARARRPRWRFRNRPPRRRTASRSSRCAAIRRPSPRCGRRWRRTAMTSWRCADWPSRWRRAAPTCARPATWGSGW
jgi:hypothetical protein